jgi:FlaA1/EpsC-like NDP-sugar epimerase
MSLLSRRFALLIVDTCLFAASLVAAFVIRFEGTLPPLHTTRLLTLLPFVVGARLIASSYARVYRISWRFVSVRDIPRLGATIAVPTAIMLALRLLSLPGQLAIARLPLSIIALESLLSFLAFAGVRVGRRLVAEISPAPSPQAPERKRVLLIGAGQTGFVIAREVASHGEGGITVTGFVDDDPAKRGQTVFGLEVLGNTSELGRLVERHQIDHVIITIPSATRAEMRAIIEKCAAVPVRAQMVPAIHDLVDGTVSFSRIRDVAVEDLLGRGSVTLDFDAIGAFLRGARVMVTGAGGSIGSELCRQVCKFEPASLALVERCENSLFEIDRELRASFPGTKLLPCIADICDVPRMEQVFVKAKPLVVIHAAAHKHVPLMEENVGEAVKNNVFGTRTLTDMANRNGVEAFVMISTDKAVNPTSVMGATKRVAELYVQSLSRGSRTRFLTTRFGNVLGSAGSVIPIFKQQILNGGPITVTHPDMKRYFMTIPEASQLVLQAATMGRGGEIFVLDMGEPVRIISLAEQLIRLSGLKPYDDIDIAVTGIRPGEKLFEEIALNEEDASKTRHPKIFIGRYRPISLDRMESVLHQLERALVAGDDSALRSQLMSSVREDVREPSPTPVMQQLVQT